jgi:dihydrodipicolinate synthase/N-acetylneuraminate lyase
MNLQGIFPAVTTPFGPDGGVSFSRLRQNIERYNQTRVAGYVLSGSTGEAVMRFRNITCAWRTRRAFR